MVRPWTPEPTRYESPDAVCPWCSEPQSDSWEFNLWDGDTTEHDCNSCGRTMVIECHVTVEYSARAVTGTSD